MPLDGLSTGPTTQQPAATQTASTSPEQAFTFVEDIGGNRGIKVVLEDTDMVHGRARELSAFQSGGKMIIAQDGIYNPGTKRVILQMMASKLNKMVVKGAFRDRIRAGAQRQPGGAEPNHARYMRDLIERVRERANPLKISWNGDERGGVLEEAVFDEEGPHDITYTLTFFIATSPTGATQQTTSPTSPTPSIDDLRAQMALAVAEQQVELDALVVNAVAVAAISNGLGFVSAALDTLASATSTLERAVQSTPQVLRNQVNAVVAGAQAVSTQVQNFKNVASGLDSTDWGDVMQDQSVDAQTQWVSWQMTTECVMDQILDAMRQAKVQSIQQVQSATRLYRVQPQDTLEGIALQQLGSKARASDLGIRPDQLVPGAYVRIPQAN